ncbi:I78 family peptidase inhibitor [Aureimonas mangrovi]|uniref:I78 family peptidase inhibitor n=1 Tax=Aureimonas mangrovi TaxID=2758041 RepID=UPI001FE38246|nr:I78 family peptidase inhibitor [Aureimonas mangrovi]
MACDRAAAERLVGQARPTDDAARTATGASTVRQIGPGDPVTRDFRVDRVTIETDPATGRVTAASCG